VTANDAAIVAVGPEEGGGESEDRDGGGDQFDRHGFLLKTGEGLGERGRTAPMARPGEGADRDGNRAKAGSCNGLGNGRTGRRRQSAEDELAVGEPVEVNGAVDEGGCEACRGVA